MFIIFKLFKKAFLLILVVAYVAFMIYLFRQPLPPKSEPEPEEVAIKNVIVFIADGTGANHYAAAGVTQLGGKFSQGTMTTNSATVGWPTDSAAAATALATGVKVENGNVGNTNKNISEIAKEQGKSVGIITTDDIYGATPAGFSARASNVGETLGRYRVDEIIRTQKESSIDLFMGRKDTDHPDLNYGTDERFQTFVDPKPLRQMIEPALEELVKNPKGFFLMAEGARVDWYSHGNDLSGAKAEVIDFKNAVEYAYDWAKTRHDTAIIVTSDHETGGLTPDEVGNGYHWTVDSHTAVPVPFWTFFIDEERTEIDNIDVFKIAKKLVLAA